MVGYSYAISDFITDALIILIPIPFVRIHIQQETIRILRYNFTNHLQIWQLCLPPGQKIAVLGVFFLGILAAGSSLVRLAWMVWNQTQGLGPQTDEERKHCPSPLQYRADSASHDNNGALLANARGNAWSPSCMFAYSSRVCQVLVDGQEHVDHLSDALCV
jgi:hypothetical protein